MNRHSAKPLLATDIDIIDILEDEHILHFHVDKNMIRIASIIDVNAHYKKLENPSKRVNDVPAIGKGHQLEIALERALSSLRNGLSHDHVYRNLDKPEYRRIYKSLKKSSKQTSSVLDYFLVRDKGNEITFTKDSVGHVTVTLHNRDEDTNRTVVYSGTSKSVNKAMTDAIRAYTKGPVEQFTKYSNYPKKEAEVDYDNLPVIKIRKDRVSSVGDLETGKVFVRRYN